MKCGHDAMYYDSCYNCTECERLDAEELIALRALAEAADKIPHGPDCKVNPCDCRRMKIGALLAEWRKLTGKGGE